MLWWLDMIRKYSVIMCTFRCHIRILGITTVRLDEPQRFQFKLRIRYRPSYFFISCFNEIFNIKWIEYSLDLRLLNLFCHINGNMVESNKRHPQKKKKKNIFHWCECRAIIKRICTIPCYELIYFDIINRLAFIVHDRCYHVEVAIFTIVFLVL